MTDWREYMTGGPASTLGHAITDNPVPVALIGVGAGWLLFNAIRGEAASDEDLAQSTYADPAYAGPQVGETTFDEAGRAAGETAEAARRRARSAYAAARRQAAGAWSAARHRAERLGGQVRERAVRARRGADGLLQEQPLLIGALGLAVGAALGAALPRSRYEDEWLGETRDDLLHAAEEFGREQWERGERVVERAAEAAGDEARRQGFTPEHVREGAESVAAAAADAAKHEAERSGPT